MSSLLSTLAVRVMRVAPLDADMYVNETFCKLICVAGADISDLAKLACAEFPPTYAGQVAFFVVPDEARARAIQRDPSFANDILLGEPLFASNPVISPLCWPLSTEIDLYEVAGGYFTPGPLGGNALCSSYHWGMQCIDNLGR